MRLIKHLCKANLVITSNAIRARRRQCAPDDGVFG